MTQKTRVLFVCLGNICRSPMAEGVLRKKIAERGLSDRLTTDSCGTGPWHAGEGADPRTAEVLRRHGAHYDHVARQLTSADFTDWDWLLVMDDSNLRNVESVRPAGTPARVARIGEISDGLNVLDPWHDDLPVFEQVYAQVDRYLDGWLDRWGH